MKEMIILGKEFIGSIIDEPIIINQSRLTKRVNDKTALELLGLYQDLHDTNEKIRKEILKCHQKITPERNDQN